MARLLIIDAMTSETVRQRPDPSTMMRVDRQEAAIGGSQPIGCEHAPDKRFHRGF